MIRLQNNLHLRTASRTKAMVLNSDLPTRIDIANNMYKIITYLRKNKMFIDGSINKLVKFDNTRDITSPNDILNYIKIIDPNIIKFCIFNSEYICPMYTDTISELHILIYDKDSNTVHSSNVGLGIKIINGNIDDIRNKELSSSIQFCSLEEIDLYTFDPYQYLIIGDVCSLNSLKF